MGAPVSVLRRHDGDGARVTNIELFFDLVYVFAVTQLSHHLSATHSVDGAIQTAVLLAMVWQVWTYTTWMTNYINPDQPAMRLTIIAVMLASLVFAAALPEAFGDRAWLVAILYAGIQLGRSLIGIVLLRGEALQPVFIRFMPWLALGAVPMLAGAAVDGHTRELLWAVSMAIEVIGSAVGFWAPGLGLSHTSDWTITGGHFAERCQAFVLIALGESVVVTGSTLTRELAGSLPAERVVTFLVAFAGATALWWVYFDRTARESAEEIEASDDPGRMARNAFHWVHPLIVGGIIVTAAADERVLEAPSARGDMATAWLVLGGTALFLAGHAVFKLMVWRVASWQRIGGAAILLLLLIVAPHVTALVLGICALVVIGGVIVGDRIQGMARDRGLSALASSETAIG